MNNFFYYLGITFSRKSDKNNCQSQLNKSKLVYRMKCFSYFCPGEKNIKYFYKPVKQQFITW